MTQDAIYLSVNDLCFDPENPRLPEGLNGFDETEVLEWMLRQGDCLELVSSIGATGYSKAEPLLVTKHHKEPGKYIVVEGNRRLAALKLLNEPNLAPIKQKSVQEAVNNASEKPTSVPAIEYEKRQDAFPYLGYRHIAGIKAWGPLQKARYIDQLLKHYKNSGIDETDAFTKIATASATRPSYAKKALTTLAIYELAKEEGYWNIEKISSASIDFSVLATALNHTAIVEFIGLKSATDYSLDNILRPELTNLFQWLFAKEIGDKSRVAESRQLSTLAKVVSNKEALQAFKAGRTLQEASIYTDELDETFQKLIAQAINSVDQAEKLVPRITPSELNLDMLRDLQALVRRAGHSLKERQTSSKDEF
ncbi:MAG: ParB N-terminal domain-containing protein [Candidatus Adiutrix sp.]